MSKESGTTKVAKKLIEWGAEGLWQQLVVGVVSALIGGAAVTALMTFLKQNWQIAGSAGALACVLIYVLLSLVWSKRQLRRSMDGVNSAFAALEGSVAALPQQLASLSGGSVAGAPANRATWIPTIISQRLGNPPVRAIGVLNSITIQFLRIGDERFECSVDVEVVGLAEGAEWSPFSLRLTDRDGREELANLTVAQGAHISCPGQVRYQGRGSWYRLMRAVEATMDGLVFPLNRGPWHTLPPEGPLFCDLELHLPDGKEGQDHWKSQARLAFEIRGLLFQRVTARISPWESDDRAATITLL